jgi:hypothetical protein
VKSLLEKERRRKGEEEIITLPSSPFLLFPSFISITE